MEQAGPTVGSHTRYVVLPVSQARGERHALLHYGEHQRVGRDSHTRPGNCGGTPPTLYRPYQEYGYIPPVLQIFRERYVGCSPPILDNEPNFPPREPSRCLLVS